MIRTSIIAALCFGLLSLTAWSSPVPEEALVAYYPLNEGTGYRARDLSGNGNDGKIMRAQWTKLGKRFALQFDGMDDHIFCGSPAIFWKRNGLWQSQEADSSQS